MRNEHSPSESKQRNIDRIQQEQKCYRQLKSIFVPRADIDKQKLRRAGLKLSYRDAPIVRVTDLGKQYIFWGSSLLGLMLLLGFIGFRLIQGPPKDLSNSSPDPSIASVQKSFGENILIDDEIDSNQDASQTVGNQEKNCSAQIEEFKREKKLGAESMKAKQYAKAVEAYQKARKICKNSPETFIYLNNAEVEVQKEKGNLPIYKLAVVVPTNLPMKNRALEMLRGFAHAQDEINKGSEIRIQLSIFNDNNDANDAKSLATDIAKDISILAVMGHWSSKVTEKTAENYNNSKLVLISPISTASTLKNYENVFRLNTSTDRGAEELFRYISEKCNNSKAYILYNSGDTYSDKLFTAITRVRDKLATVNQVCAIESHSNINEFRNSESRIQELASKIEKGVVNTLVVIPDPEQKHLEDALSILSHPEISRNREKFTLVGDIANMQSPYFTKGKNGKFLKDMIMSLPFIDSASSDPRFSERSRELWGANVNWASAMSYEAAKVLGQALSQATRNNASVTRERIKSELVRTDFVADGVGGEKITFQPDDHIFLRTPSLVQVCPDVNSKEQKFVYRKIGCQ
jgi:branched-chain amino acid transport system substrate-binding protein